MFSVFGSIDWQLVTCQCHRDHLGCAGEAGSETEGGGGGDGAGPGTIIRAS